VSEPLDQEVSIYSSEWCTLLTADVLAEDKGECVICLDDMRCGDAIARLPCLCVYHKRWVLWNRARLLCIARHSVVMVVHGTAW